MNTVGRNDPCPCGSGKKYKKCCLPHDAALAQRTLAKRPPKQPKEQPFIAEVRPDLDKAVDRLLARVERGERQGLEAEFEALLKKHPDYHMTNYAMGVYRAMVQQDPEGAIPFFEKAVRVFPLLAEAHFNLGNCYLKIARIPEAVEAYRAAMSYSDGRDGIDDLAQKELDALEEITQDTTGFSSLDALIENQQLFDRAFEQLRQQEYEKAADLFGQVLKQNPEHVQSYGNLALAHAGLGHKAAALECLDKALALDPSYEPALNNRRVIKRMTEGEPFIPEVFAETDYYHDRVEAEAERPRNKRWWRKLIPWKAEALG